MVNNGILKIENYLNQLNPAERKVADYILAHREKVIHLSITRLAKEAGVSEATIVKLCQRVGFSGYQELKIRLAQSESGEDRSERMHIYGEIKANDDIKTIVKKMFQTYKYTLDNTEKLLEEDKIKNCIDMILNSKRIYFFGYGSSGIVARGAELKFKRINFQAEAITDVHSQKMVSSFVNKDDLIIAISYSGRTREIIEALEVAKGEGTKIISVTSNLGTLITDMADINLLTSYGTSNTPLKGSDLASRLAQQAILDILFLGVTAASYQNTVAALNKSGIILQRNKL